MNKITINSIIVLLLLSSKLSAFNQSGLVELEEEDLRNVSGQGLFVADMVEGDELANPNAYSTPFNFYRVGMDCSGLMNPDTNVGW